MKVPRVKIYCIASVAKARMVIDADASALGLVSAMPSGPGPIDEDLIAEIAAALPSHVASFLLTSRQDADAIIEQHRRCRTLVVQPADHVASIHLRRWRTALRAVKLVQAIHVTGAAALARAKTVAPLVDALLLDSGDPMLAVKQLGGTGRTHDRALSRRIRDGVRVPVWLAGGLGAHNIAAAVDSVQPHGVDVCGSLRTQGRLDAVKLQAFFAALARL